MAAKENDAANHSFVGELPKHSVPTHCCGKVKITTMMLGMSTAVFMEFSAILFCMISMKSVIEFVKIDDIYFSIIGCFLLFFLTSMIVLAIIGVLKETRLLLMPVLVTEIVTEIIHVAGGLCFFTIGHEKASLNEITILVPILVCSFLLHFYYILVLITCFRHVKIKQDVENFIARQKMIDEVCVEMWEEEQESIMQQERHDSRMIEYYQDSYSLSDSSIELTYYRHTLRNPQRRVSFYDPDETSF